MLRLFIALAAYFVAVSSNAAPSRHGEALCDAILLRYQPTIDSMTGKGWDHSNSAILHGMERIYAKTRDPRYLAYIMAYVDAHVAADGSISGLRDALDGIHPGVLCLFLFDETGQEKYRVAAKRMRDFVLGGEENPPFPQTPEGGFWHKATDKYRNVMTVDGTYMAYPFLVRYGVKFDDPEAIDTAVEQTLLAAERSFNIKTGLPYHAWDFDKAQPWAHPVTGTSSQHWSRCSGWFAMALVDMLEALPKDHRERPRLLRLFQDLAAGLRSSQDPETGMWYQVPDQRDAPGNYAESSGTGMAVYALRKGVDLELLDPAFARVAALGWQGLLDHVKPHADGGPQVTSVAPAMGCQTSLEAYLAIRPVSVPANSGTQHPHGYIALLMAASVMDR